MYSRRLDGKELSFEHARFLHNGSFVMYDRETISLWIHTTGKSVIGPYQGKTLKFLPSVVTTWTKWRTRHPESLVLDVKKGKNSRFRLRKSPNAGGLSVGEPTAALKLYPLPILATRKVVNDTLGGKKIVVVFDAEDWVFAAFERGDRKFTWKNGKLVDQAGKQWDLLTGTSGKLQLKRVPAVTWLTRYWLRFYPQGLVYPEK